jgi:pteridine reductase
MNLSGRNVLITGAAVRVGAAMARAVAAAGANVIIHYGSSAKEAKALQEEIETGGRKAYLLKADLADPQAVARVIPQARKHGPLYALVNSASIFEDLDLGHTTRANWQRHMDINLTAPFLLSQAFAKAAAGRGKESARIVNILDWRALRPGADHLPYTVSKAALAALTQSLAATMAPKVLVNGIAFGSILPPSTGKTPKGLMKKVPAGRWAKLEEVGETLVFLLRGPAYITGEIIYLDGGRHLV